MANHCTNDAEPNTNSLSGQSINVRRRVNLQVSHHSGETPGLVFLHGGLGNRFNWRSQYEFFVRQAREVLAYDLAGNEQSSPQRRYSLGRHRRDLSRLLGHYEMEAPILCCHSYGVPIGLEWARRNQASGLILIAGGTHNLDPWWEIPLIKFLTWGGRYLFHFPVVQSFSNRLSSEIATEKLEQFFAENPMPTELHPYKALEIFWGYNFWNRNNLKDTPGDRFNHKLSIPALVISGGKDPLFTKEMGAALASSFQYGRHLHIPVAGHLLIAEYSEVVNDAISEFLSNYF